MELAKSYVDALNALGFKTECKPIFSSMPSLDIHMPESSSVSISHSGALFVNATSQELRIPATALDSNYVSFLKFRS